ncbi:hypothetical protein E2C01_082206 [Portunus trituberculatus]|uniref:Uncharacterized protein n=1 Tax=Portunus trituberculatus TaxID=210409 RepID=A0A5B7IXV1_PORTR|nr:hypothetical protein [Portunus trituberculatus]
MVLASARVPVVDEGRVSRRLDKGGDGKDRAPHVYGWRRCLVATGVGRVTLQSPFDSIICWSISRPRPIDLKIMCRNSLSRDVARMAAARHRPPPARRLTCPRIRNKIKVSVKVHKKVSIAKVLCAV